jgi:hypothetical protein
MDDPLCGTLGEELVRAFAAHHRGDQDGATALFRQVLSGPEQPTPEQIVVAFMGLTAAAATSGKLQRAARLYGATEVYRKVVGGWPCPVFAALPQSHLHSYGGAVAAVVYFGDNWEACVAEGQRWTLAEAVAFSLSEEEDQEPTDPDLQASLRYFCHLPCGGSDVP